jgi:ppGpp synthetase/RelA/SpoT-type nucleotidyltranferase
MGQERMLDEEAELRRQISEYAEQLPDYKEYAKALEDVLKSACVLYAPLAIVSARPKSIASFAEKAARKKYKNPIREMTDLCGARVIVNTQDDVKAICQFVRANFKIDEANSLDAASRLKETEFGYRSLHYIVQVHQPSILGAQVPAKVIAKGLKAEIQVRTVAQHAWAATMHDRLYKPPFQIPTRLRRLGHRIAALLEDADEALNEFERGIQPFLGSYSAYMKPSELDKEIKIVKLVLDVEAKAENKDPIALRLARLLRAGGRLGEAIDTLKPHFTTMGPMSLPIRVELGTALIELHHCTPAAEGFKLGQSLLREAVAAATTEEVEDDTTMSTTDRKLRATAMAILADTSDRQEACQQYRGALQLDPEDPYILCSQLAYNLDHTSQPAILDSARPAILKAIATCRAHVDAGLQIPRAWFTMARLFLLLRKDTESLDHYSKAICFFSVDEKPKWSKEDFEAELEFLKRIQGRGQPANPEIGWAEQLLRIGFWLKSGRPGPITEAVRREVSFKDFRSGQRVLIVAGGTAPEWQERMTSYRKLLRAALEGYDGLVISGGTTAGIPGIVGEVASDLKSAGRKSFTLIGYQPEFVRSRSDHYDRHVRSGTKETLGLAEPLQMWLDILAAGVDPTDVRLLGINGGRISRFEYALALSLGALVGLVESSERSADDVLRDPDWSKLPTLLPLPNDPMTAQAFAQVGAHDFSKDELERMGRLVHETYRKGTKPDHKKPNTLPWEVLPEDYKQSSREQAAYAFRILRARGFTIRKVEKVSTSIVMPEEDVKVLAEKEHGRWNVERLRAGWRRASKKDDDKRLSPFLKPWVELPDEISEFDWKAVRAFPEILAAGGYELVPPAQT